MLRLIDLDHGGRRDRHGHGAEESLAVDDAAPDECRLVAEPVDADRDALKPLWALDRCVQPMMHCLLYVVLVGGTCRGYGGYR